ncbi:MAG: hypothetical protein ACOX5G_03000 [Kiritimatiellia bacterium]
MRKLALALAWTWSGALPLFAAPALTGETSNPANNCFARGTPVVMTLKASGLPAESRRPFVLGVYDHKDRRVGEVKGDIVADAEGAWTGGFSLPSERYGFYRVRVDDAGGLEFPKVGSRPANCITYAVLADPASRPVLSQEEAFFGLHGNASGAADLAPWLGARQQMGGIDPRKPPSDAAWPRYGYLVCSRLEPWQPLFACFEPAFQKDVLQAKKITWTVPLVDMEGGAEALDRAMRNYAELAKENWPPNMPRRVYEIFWEPDLTMASPGQLVRAAKVVHAAIHAVDPQAIVAAPSFSNARSHKLLRECLEAGLGDCMEALSVHCYNAFPPEANAFVDNIRRTKALLREYLGKDIPLVGTENGYLAVATQDEEYLQMTGHVRVQLILLGEGFWFNCPFYGYDHHATCQGDYGLTYNLENTPGKTVWGPHRVSPRPALAALSAASHLLDGYRPTCTIEWLGETVLGYAYQNGAGDCRLALWDFGGTSEVEIPIGGGPVELADMMGNRRTVQANDGQLKLALGAEPVYVLGVDPSIWGKAAQAELKWSDRKFKRADADAPVQIARVLPSFERGEPGVSVALENGADARIEGELEVRIRGIPEARQAVRFDVEAGGAATVRLAMPDFTPDPFASYDVETTVAPEKAKSARKAVRLNFLPARKMETWDELVLEKAPATKGRNGYTIADDNDCSVALGLGWNERWFFLGFTVTDDEFSNTSTGAMSWQGDAIQVGLAKDPFVKPTPNSYADDLNRALTETTLALTPEGPTAWRTMTFDDETLPCGKNGRIDASECPLEIVNEKTDVGVLTHYRVAIPWKFLNMNAAKAGDVVWFAAMVNDQDADTLATELKSCSIDIFDLKQAMPKNFGAVTLCAD